MQKVIALSSLPNDMQGSNERLEWFASHDEHVCCNWAGLSLHAELYSLSFTVHELPDLIESYRSVRWKVWKPCVESVEAVAAVFAGADLCGSRKGKSSWHAGRICGADCAPLGWYSTSAGVSIEAVCKRTSMIAALYLGRAGDSQGLRRSGRCLTQG